MSKSYKAESEYFDSADDSELDAPEEVVEEAPAPVEAPKSDGVSVVRLPSGQITNKPQ